MRIGLTIDALAAERTGIGRYTWELCRGLQGHPAISDLSFIDNQRLFPVVEDFFNVQKRKGLNRSKSWRAWCFNRYQRKRLIHATNYFLPEGVEGGIVTIHDLSVFLHPDSHPPERIRAFETGFPSSLARSSHIITDSDYIRNQLISLMGVAEEKISAVSLGVAEAFRPIPKEELQLILRPLLGDAADGYILAVSTFEPRKRIQMAIQAHAQLCDSGRTRLPLVLAGASGWCNDELRELIVREEGKGRLCMLGHVSENILPHLYAGSRLFVYLSIYEGFGLPPLEAMRCGIPTLVANRSCLPEVTGGAAMLTDPDDVDRISVDMERALYDNEWRSIAVAAGLDVARGYTWSKCIDQTVSVYEGNWRQP